MPVARYAVLVLLVAAAICFVVFAVTGKQRYRQVGLKLLLGTLAAAFVLFAVLIVENLVQ